jgi:hypothetical protein
VLPTTLWVPAERWQLHLYIEFLRPGQLGWPVTVEKLRSSLQQRFGRPAGTPDEMKSAVAEWLEVVLAAGGIIPAPSHEGKGVFYSVHAVQPKMAVRAYERVDPRIPLCKACGKKLDALLAAVTAYHLGCATDSLF